MKVKEESMGKLVNLETNNTDGSVNNNTDSFASERPNRDDSGGKYEQLGRKIGCLVDSKNAAYGNSFDQAGDFLRLLYPNGIRPDQYGDMLCVVRIFDKLKRIATKKDAFGESPYQDIVGYGLLGTERDIRLQETKEEEAVFKNTRVSQEEASYETSSTHNGYNKDIDNQDVNQEVQNAPVETKEEVTSNVSANDSSIEANESRACVPMHCIVCGEVVAEVDPALAKNQFIHYHCFSKLNSQGLNDRVLNETPLPNLSTKTTSP
jgi:hypothetical protein